MATMLLIQNIFVLRKEHGTNQLRDSRYRALILTDIQFPGVGIHWDTGGERKAHPLLGMRTIRRGGA